MTAMSWSWRVRSLVNSKLAVPRFGKAEFTFGVGHVHGCFSWHGIFAANLLQPDIVDSVLDFLLQIDLISW